jgi:hypothetical protein
MFIVVIPVMLNLFKIYETDSNRLDVCPIMGHPKR